MDKTGRNDPCPCGSGKKYKKCCLPMHEADERQQLAEQQAERDQRAAAHRASLREARAAMLADVEDDADELDAASNAAVDLVRAGKLDEAERAARDLLKRFPDVHDGWDRLGMVYEARGDNQKAADCYRKVIDFIRAHPDDYDDAFADIFAKRVDKLDPAD
jgi:tetratricopeptide (TPR) repeat protein